MSYDEMGMIQHRLELEGRERLLVSGVEEVERFDEEEIVMNTTAGTLVVGGMNLHNSMVQHQPNINILPSLLFPYFFADHLEIQNECDIIKTTNRKEGLIWTIRIYTAKSSCL